MVQWMGVETSTTGEYLWLSSSIHHLSQEGWTVEQITDRRGDDMRPSSTHVGEWRWPRLLPYAPHQVSLASAVNERGASNGPIRRSKARSVSRCSERGSGWVEKGLQATPGTDGQCSNALANCRTTPCLLYLLATAYNGLCCFCCSGALAARPAEQSQSRYLG